MTDDDLNDAWCTLCKGTGSLWCHGVRKSGKQPDSSGKELDSSVLLVCVYAYVAVDLWCLFIDLPWSCTGPS